MPTTDRRSCGKKRKRPSCRLPRLLIGRLHSSATSNANPLTVPGVTTINNGPLAVAAETLTSITLPATAQELTVTAASTIDAPLQLVVLNALGSVVGTSDNASGFATVDIPVKGGATHLIKVVNLSLGPIEVWSASTALLKK